MERLEEELTCAVCCGIFRDPRVLPCSHTFCRECLQGVLQLSPRSCLRCPSCRAVLDLPAPTALQALPTSFALRAVIDKWQQQQQEEEPRAEGTCPEHPRQPLNIYCLLDRQGVCGLCLTSGRHRGHPIADPQRAAGRLRGQLTDGHWRDVQPCHTRLTMQKSQCEELLRSEREVVVQYFSKLGETLERKKEALLRALEELNRRFLEDVMGSPSLLAQTKTEEHEPLVEEVSKMKVEEIELKYLNASVRKEKSPLLCLEKLEELQQRIEALQQKELPDVRPLEIYPRMEDLLRNVWSRTEIGQIHKILPPKLKLIPRRKSCSKCPGKENRDSKEQLWAVKLLPVLLLLVGVAGAAFYLHKALPAGAIQAAPAWGMEFLLHVYQNSCTHVQRAVDGLCHTFTSLMGLCRGIVPFDFVHGWMPA